METVVENFFNNKRFRDDSEESPEVKRIRTDLLLDEDADSVDRNPAVEELASFMRIFEEEIALPPPQPPSYPDNPAADLRPNDLGYLLEASDDELGLPPPFPSSSEEGEDPEVEVVDAGQAEDARFGQIWGFDDGCYDELDFGFRTDERGVLDCGEEGVIFDGGLFDYTDVLCGPFDFSDSSWRKETLPAV